MVAAAMRGFKMVLRPTDAATRGFTVVSFTEAVSRRNTFVGGTCASLSFFRPSRTYYAPTVGKGEINVVFVRPFVCLSVRPSRT